MFHTILFDLDGTLTDPGMGITNFVAYALEKWGFPVPERKELYAFIGPPLKDSFMKFYGLSPEDAVKSIGYYREYYCDQGIHECEVIPDTQWLLDTLKREGKQLILATSKPEEFAIAVLKEFHLDGYFDLIAGASMDEKLCEKADIIACALERAGVKDLASTVMVGDREHDVLGARKNGLPCIGVLFGYGSREELTECGAISLAGSMKELYAQLRGE